MMDISLELHPLVDGGNRGQLSSHRRVEHGSATSLLRPR